MYGNCPVSSTPLSPPLTGPIWLGQVHVGMRTKVEAFHHTQPQQITLLRIRKRYRPVATHSLLYCCQAPHQLQHL